MRAKKGIVSSYDQREGRGEIALDDGGALRFHWTEVEVSDGPCGRGNGPNWNAPIGSGFQLCVGDRVLYDRNGGPRTIRLDDGPIELVDGPSPFASAEDLAAFREWRRARGGGE